MKKYIVPIILMIMTISVVSASEMIPINPPEEVTNVETEIVDENTENIEYEEPVEEDREVPEGDGFVHIKANILEGTYVVSDEIVLKFYNYDTNGTNYALLKRENNYESTVSIPNGMYEASISRSDKEDDITFYNPNFTLENNKYNLDLNITGVSYSEYEKIQEEKNALNSDNIEIVDTSNDETSVENAIETEEQSQPLTVEKTPSAFMIFLGFIIDNLFVLLLLIGSLVFLGIYKYKQNNNK